MSEHASTAKASFGFVFYRHNGITFQEVHNMRMQGLPNVDVSEQETTHMNSPNRKREFKPTLGEDVPYDCEIDFDIDDPAHRGLFRDAFGIVDGGLFKLEFPDLDVVIQGSGFVRNWKWPAMDPAGIQKATFTFRESPAWDWDLAIPA